MGKWELENLECGQTINAADFLYGDYVDLTLLRNAENAFENGDFHQSISLYQQTLDKLRTYDGDKYFYFYYGKMISDALDEAETALLISGR